MPPLFYLAANFLKGDAGIWGITFQNFPDGGRFSPNQNNVGSVI
jgi:hypothetical protein